MSAEARDRHDPAMCRAREILDLVADKWSLYVVSYLGHGSRRFTELKHGIDGISQRMLTVTLRGLERDGILTRTVYPDATARDLRAHHDGHIAAGSHRAADRVEHPASVPDRRSARRLRQPQAPAGHRRPRRAQIGRASRR